MESSGRLCARGSSFLLWGEPGVRRVGVCGFFAGCKVFVLTFIAVAASLLFLLCRRCCFVAIPALPPLLLRCYWSLLCRRCCFVAIAASLDSVVAAVAASPLLVLCCFAASPLFAASLR
jgi:hypothetical protein